jgi:hypothetical protein
MTTSTRSRRTRKPTPGCGAFAPRFAALPPEAREHGLGLFRGLLRARQAAVRLSLVCDSEAVAAAVRVLGLLIADLESEDDFNGVSYYHGEDSFGRGGGPEADVAVGLLGRQRCGGEGQDKKR